MKKRASAGWLLFGVWQLAVVAALGPGCAAREPMAGPPGAGNKEAATADAAPPSESKFPSQAGYPAVSSADPNLTLDAAEKALDLALEGKDMAGVPLATTGDHCALVCKALDSMRSAAAHVCELDQSRCDGVKTRVQRAEQRAKDSCPSCATPT